jgi:TolB-like protein/AraC-like DNA-binding protein/tetratricopeptide (TPR) repeat protein
MTEAEKRLIEKLNEFIEVNANNPIFSNEHIYRELGISRSQLYRLLKEEFDLSTSLYIRKRRLLKAKELIENSELKISEIAYQIGIDSPQNFTKYFSQEYGLSPTEYRKNLPQLITNSPTPIVEKEAEFQVKEVITETKTERIIEGKITIEQKIKEEITERRIEHIATRISQKTEAKISKKVTYLLVALALSVLLFSIFLIWQNTQKNTNDIAKMSISVPIAAYQSAALYEDLSIAVLPFKNLGKPENSTFVDGIMEQVHTSLSQLENLKIISKTSSNQFRNTTKKLPQIANELHVNYIIEGSVMQIEKQLRINIQLIHAKEDRVIWGKNYDGDMQNVFAYMSSVSKEVVTELNQKLSMVQQKKLEKIPTKSLEAYNEYLQGKELLQTRTKEKLEASLLRLEEAIRLDSTFADAYAQKANAYFLLLDAQYINIQKGYQLVENYAFKAIKLDNENALAYATLANMYREQDKWSQAITTYQIALKYSPNDALINYWYSLVLRSTGNLKESVRYSQKAMHLDPLSQVIIGGHILNCSLAGNLDLAQQAIKEGALLFNNSWTYYWGKAYFHLVQKDYQTALNELEKSHQLNPNVKSIKYHIIFCKGKLGRTQEVQDFLKMLPEIPDNYAGFVVAYAGLGDKERAMQYLEKCADAGMLPFDLKVLPFYDLLRQDQRYQAILQKFGLEKVDLQ